MQLPDMTGLELLAALQADAATRSLRVVALSANALPEDVAAARRAGVEAYWTKPIDFAQVLQGVAERLRAAEAQREPVLEAS
jgi:CheY-like chemotaxis protein